MSAKGFISFLAGAAIGAVAVWLATSDEGREKVEELKKKASETLEGLEGKVEDLKAKAEAQAKAAVDAVEEKLGK